MSSKANLILKALEKNPNLDQAALLEIAKGGSSINNGGSNEHVPNRDSSPSLSEVPPVDEVSIEPLEIQWRALPFDNPLLFRCFYDKKILEGEVTLHKWQADDLEMLGCIGKIPTSKHPFKYCLVTCNGSGKDAYIIASFVAWFASCKIRARVILTSSSGVQLTSQTENYIRSLCQAVNEKHQCEIFRIRQRYITCRLSGSEIRLFATDEEGKAEGYHPLDPGAEMAIIVNEAKSVTKEIHRALRRCTGYNYWLEISTPGEKKGDFYKAATNWPTVRRISYKECPHLSEDEYGDDLLNEGESSAYFRSKWMGLFTSEVGKAIISDDLIESLLLNPPAQPIKLKELRYGIDLAAGGDKNAIIGVNGSKCILEKHFRDKNTVTAAEKINDILLTAKVPKDCKHIYGDDGGVGRAILDMLETNYGWKINRVMNQWAAVNKKRYGNRGAENWQRVARIMEERLFDVSTLSETARNELTSRHYRDATTSGRLFLEKKSEARAEGRPSPDIADALVLSLTGLTVKEFLKEQDDKIESEDNRPKEKFTSQQQIYEFYEGVTFEGEKKDVKRRRVFNSLQTAIKNQETINN